MNNKPSYEFCDESVVKVIAPDGSTGVAWCGEPVAYKGVMANSDGLELVIYRCSTCAFKAANRNPYWMWTGIESVAKAATSQHKCQCSMTQIMRSGCKCGGK